MYYRKERRIFYGLHLPFPHLIYNCVRFCELTFNGTRLIYCFTYIYYRTRKLILVQILNPIHHAVTLIRANMSIYIFSIYNLKPRYLVFENISVLYAKLDALSLVLTCQSYPIKSIRMIRKKVEMKVNSLRYVYPNGKHVA